MNQRGLVAGFYASAIGLVFGSAVGGLGMWTAVAASAKTPLGGFLILLLVGSALGYVYTSVKFDQLFGKEIVVKGASFGVIIWILGLIIAGFFPALSQSAFVEPLRSVLFVQLLTHIVWGAALGLFFEEQKR